jgi:predicted negative regulator of RcsB-dependent stress response
MKKLVVLIILGVAGLVAYNYYTSGKILPVVRGTGIEKA